MSAKKATRGQGLHGAAKSTGILLLVCASVLPARSAFAQSWHAADGSLVADREQAAASWRGDAEFNGNWGLAAIRAEYAYAQGYSGLGARVGVLDQPVWSAHPEFAASVAGDPKLSFITTRGIRTYDDPYLPYRAGDPFIYDGQLYVDGYDEIATHGTHVAGIAAANRDSVAGRPGVMQGVAYAARIFAADVGDPGPEDGIVRGNDGGTYLAAWRAMIDSRVDVITNSWGIGITWGGGWQFVDAGKQFLEIQSLLGTPAGGAYDGALQAARSGIVVEFSAGNDSGQQPDAMAGLASFVPGIENNWITTMSLARTASGLQASGFSTICGYTRYYCVAAPGSAINSSVATGDIFGLQPGDPVPDPLAAYESFSGTSMAGPFVSGAIGVLKGRYPYLANGDLAQILKTTSRDLGTPGVDEIYGWGLIDLQKAMAGPGQLMSRLVADLPAGTTDVWANDIGDAALQQRQTEAQVEIAAWQQRKIDMGWENGWASVDTASLSERLYVEYRPLASQARVLARRLLVARATPPYADFRAALAAVENDPLASAIIKEYGKIEAWLPLGPDLARFDSFLASRYPDDETLAREVAAAKVQGLAQEYVVQEARIASLLAATYENGLTKRGAGELRLTGNNSYRGETRVEAGRLRVDGALGGAVAVYGQGILGGNGRVGSLLAQAGGTVAPGASIGTLSVAGDARFESGSLLAVEISGDGRSDHLAVAGKATLAGGLLGVQAEDASVALETFVAAAAGRHAYTFLSAGGGIEGQFAGALSPYAFFRPRLSYAADRLTLDIERLPFASAGRNFNERQTAAGIDSLAPANPLYAQVLAAPAGFAAGPLFAALSGDIHPTAGGVLLAAGQVQRDAALDRLRLVETQSATAPRTWGQVFGRRGRGASDGNAASYDNDGDGFFVGGDSVLDAGWTLGFLVGHEDGKLRTANARADTGSYRLGVHAGMRRGKLGLRLGAGYGHHALSTRRNLPQASASAHYTADDWQLFGELAYEITAGRTQLAPFAGLAFTGLRREAFSEKGGGVFNLMGRAASASVATGSLGLRASRDVVLGTSKGQWSASLAWQHAAGDLTPESRLAFAGGERFVNAGVPLARNALAVAASLRVALSPTARLGIDYAGQFAAGRREHGVGASLAVAF